MRAGALDVHRDFCEVAIVDGGRVRSAGRVEARPEALELFARNLEPRDWVALEATGNVWEIARIIEPHVARVIVVSPSDTGIRQARAKTDRLDARALARLLWAGQLDGVWWPDERIRAMRRRLGRETVDSAVRQVDFLDAEIAAVEKLIAAEALSWPEIKRLMTVPGAKILANPSGKGRNVRVAFRPCTARLSCGRTRRTDPWFPAAGSAVAADSLRPS